MKRCTKCLEAKTFTEFNYKNKNKGILSSRCKICTRFYIKNHYNNNREYYLKKAQKRNNLLRKIIKNYIIEYLNSHPCVDCGEKDPIVLEFDHIKSKSFAVSKFGRNKTLHTVQDEIRKCEIRCANCHRMKTYKQFGWNKVIMPL